jgi:TPR repeat protein
MARTRILAALSVDVEDNASTDAHEPFDELPLPTLDERASVYLRAVHGDRDFTSAEHASARDLILEAMAADISERDTSARNVVTRGVAARSDSNSPIAILQDLAPMTTPMPVPLTAPITVPGLAGDHDIDQRDEEPEDVASIVPQRRRLPFLPEGRLLYGVAAVCSAATFAAALGFWAGTISQTARSTPDNSRLANQASPADPSEQTLPGSDFRIVAEAQRELASALNVARLGPDEVAALLKRGQELVAQGRFRVARVVLERAAEARNASAAFALGQTYDPLIERSAVRPDAPADNAMARTWYEKAKDLGSSDAALRLSRLPAGAPAPRSTPK